MEMLEELTKGAERNLDNLLDAWMAAVAKDIHITPAIESIKEVVVKEVLSK